jgi:hypothetical protein
MPSFRPGVLRSLDQNPNRLFAFLAQLSFQVSRHDPGDLQ